jgi:opacity protein-like surface antigen
MGRKALQAVFVLFFVLGLFGSLYAQQAGPQASQGTTPSDGKVYTPPQQQKAPEQPDPSNYFILKGGAFWPNGDLKPLGTGFNGEIGYGLRFFKYAALEIGTGYLTLGKTYRAYDPDFGSYSEKMTVYAVPLTLTLKPIIPITKEFEVFGLIGAGGYYINNKITVSVPNLGSASYTGHSVTYGGFAGAGVNYNFTRNWFIGLEGKYLSTARPKFTTNIFGERYTYNFRTEGTIGTFNIGYRF